MTYASIIQKNAVVSMLAIVEFLKSLNDENYEVNKKNKETFEFFVRLKEIEDQNYLSEMEVLGEKIKQLWSDEAIKNVIQRRNEFQLYDSAE